MAGAADPSKGVFFIQTDVFNPFKKKNILLVRFKYNSSSITYGYSYRVA